MRGRAAPGRRRLVLWAASAVAGSLAGCHLPRADGQPAPGPVIARGAAPSEAGSRADSRRTSAAPDAAALLEALRGFRYDPEPRWVAAAAVSKGSDPVPSVAPATVREEREPAVCKPPPDTTEVAPKDPPTPATPEPPRVQPKPPELRPAAPRPPAAPTSLAFPQAPVAPPSPRTPAAPPTPPARKPGDDSVLVVGGVPVALPPDAGKPGAVRPAAASVPSKLPPAPPSLPIAAVTTEPPIRRADAPRELPPLQPAPKAPATAAPPPDTAAAPAPPPPGVLDSLSKLVGGSRNPAPCAAPDADGRTLLGVCQGLCGPDAASRPRWEPVTAAAFFVDAPRPVTQTRLRWDYGQHLAFPDRGEFFWARADGAGRGPVPNRPAPAVPYLDYHELYLDQEVALGRASVAVTAPYRSVDPLGYAPTAAGFGDVQVTVKGLLYDSDLFLLTAQVRGYAPTGNFNRGLGTGHASVEPGLIAGLRVSRTTYAVAQVQEWVPLGGDRDYAGSALRYGLALNHVLWQPVRDVQFVGTWEVNGFAFQDGAFTDPDTGLPRGLAGQSAVSTGVGGRMFLGQGLDLGAAWSYGVSGKYLVRELLRVEFRYRY